MIIKDVIEIFRDASFIRVVIQLEGQTKSILVDPEVMITVIDPSTIELGDL